MKEILQAVLPGLTVMGIFFVAHIILLDIFTERERHTLTRLMSAPVTVGQFLAAKMIVAVAVCALAMAVVVAVSAGLFGTNWGTPGGLILVSLSMILALVGTLTLLQGLARTRSQIDGASNLVIMGMCVFGGSFFPAEILPPFMQAMGKWTINHWAIRGFQAVIAGDPVSHLWRPTVVLLLVGLVTLTAGIVALRRRMASGDQM
jgi:ABC-2 type transport system permease protein